MANNNQKPNDTTQHVVNFIKITQAELLILVFLIIAVLF